MAQDTPNGTAQLHAMPNVTGGAQGGIVVAVGSTAQLQTVPNVARAANGGIVLAAQLSAEWQSPWLRTLPEQWKGVREIIKWPHLLNSIVMKQETHASIIMITSWLDLMLIKTMHALPSATLLMQAVSTGNVPQAYLCCSLMVTMFDCEL
jgi:hypothetical protein